MRLIEQFQTSLFFYEKISRYKNANQTKTNQQNKNKRTTNNKGNNFLRIKSSKREKNGWFWFDLRFCSAKSFRKKIDLFEIVLLISFTILMMCTPINLPIENLFVRN